MVGLVKLMKVVAVVAKKRLSKTNSRKEKGNHARVAKAIWLIRKGAISRAGKALKSKGLGDMTNPVIWNHLMAKHLDGKREIPEDNYTFKPDEDFQLELDKLCPNLTRTQLRGRRD